MQAGPHIVVIGAGIAGLAAARRLRERDCRVSVLERSDRVGGRATSDRREGFRFVVLHREGWPPGRWETARHTLARTLGPPILRMEEDWLCWELPAAP